MKQTLLILALITSTIQTFAQSPRIKLNQITKDTVKGSVLISSPSDSGMVYSRDFYVAYGADTVLILYGDTLASTSGIISSVLSDGVTITGNGTSGNELKVDTSLIATLTALNDTLTARGYLTAEVDGSVTNELQTISTSGAAGNITLSDGGGTLNLNVDDADASATNEGSLTVGAGTATTSVISSNTSGSTDVTLTAGSNITLSETGNNITIAATGGGTTYNNISETADTLYIAKYLDVDTSTLYVDATNNRVGIGTSSPIDNLSIVENSGNSGKMSLTTYRNTTGQSSWLTQFARGTEASPQIVQNGDVIGEYVFNAYTGSSFVLGQVASITAAVNGTVTASPLSIPTDLIFNTSTSGTAYSSPRLTIKSNGNVGIGTSSPTEKLDVNGNARFRSIGSGASAGALHYTSTGVLTTNTSDVRLKTNLQPLENTLNKLLSINTYTFNWINETDRVDLGMVAQEVEQIFPNLVFTNNIDGYKGIHYDKFSSILTKAIQEQQAIIETQEQKITDLQTTIQSLITRIEILENK